MCLGRQITTDNSWGWLLTRIEQGTLPTHLLLDREFTTVVLMLVKFFANSEWCSTYCEQRELTMRQVVAFRRLTTMRIK